MNNKGTELFYPNSKDKDNKTIEITLDEYKALLTKSMAYAILKNAMVSSLRKYVSGNGLYLDNVLLEIIAVLFPKEVAKRADELRKDGDSE